MKRKSEDLVTSHITKKHLRNRPNIIRNVSLIITVLVLSVFFVPEFNKSDIDTEKKVDKVESVGVASGEPVYNSLLFEGLESREGTYSSVAGDNYWFDFYAHCDYIYYNGSWTDANGNPYIRVSYEIDTTAGYEEDVVPKATLTFKVPSQLTMVKSTYSVSDSRMSSAFSNNNRNVTITWNNGLGYKDYFVNYICTVNANSLPASILNGNSKFYAIGSDATKNTSGCAVVTTPDGTSKLTSSPGLYYYANTSSQKRVIYEDMSYIWTSNHYHVMYGFMSTQVNDSFYDSSDGGMYYLMKVAVDLVSTDLEYEDMDFSVTISDAFEFVPGTLDVTDGGSYTTANNNKTFNFKWNGSSLAQKMYYATFLIKLKFDVLPQNYYANEDFADVVVNGSSYYYPPSSYEPGAYGSYGSFGYWEMDRLVSGPRVRSTVTYNLDGGKINGSYSEYYRYGYRSTLPTDVTKNEHTFAGWHTSSGGPYGAIGKTTRYSLTLYARWEQSGFAVNLHPNGGTINSGNVTKYVKGVGVTLPTEDNITKPGYKFEGWYSNAALNGTRYYTIGTNETGTKNFWAKWSPAKYSVTFNPNGGTINSGNVMEYSYGDTVTLPTNVTKEGYDFKGWYDNPECSGTPITEITSADTGNKTYYAKWEAAEYGVILHPNGGNFVPGTEVTKYTYGVGAKLPNALIIRKAGCEFGGWYSNSALTGDVQYKIPTNATGDKEYWAKWIPFEIKTESKLCYVYGLEDDSDIFKSQPTEFEIRTDSTTANIKAYLSETNTNTAPVLTGTSMLDVIRNRMHMIALPTPLGERIANDKYDKVLFIKMKATCQQFDGDTTVTYDVYTAKEITYRFVASYEEW